jgi:class 3 adenylate cyclase
MFGAAKTFILVYQAKNHTVGQKEESMWDPVQALRTLSGRWLQQDDALWELLAPAQTASQSEKSMGITIGKLRQVNELFAKFVPETVKRLITAHPEASELSMRECDVSVLFLDICDYSRLSQQVSLRVLNALVERYFSLFLERIHAAHGDINEIAGDGFMAIFQDADPYQHVVRAVETSFALLAATEALNVANGAQPLTVHMGLNCGQALVGLTRLEGLHCTRWTFTARGPMTNLAARLTHLAGPGQILVGPEIVQRLGSRYAIQKLGDERLKNLAEPVAIYCLRGPAMCGA